MDGPAERHHKSLTELALEKRKLAAEEKRYKPGSGLAGVYEHQADDLLTLKHAPVVGLGGEVTCEQTAGLGSKRGHPREPKGHVRGDGGLGPGNGGPSRQRPVRGAAVT